MESKNLELFNKRNGHEGDILYLDSCVMLLRLVFLGKIKAP